MKTIQIIPLSFFLLLFVQTCQHKSPEHKPQTESTLSVLEPQDAFLLHRYYGADGKFSVQAYVNGLREAKQSNIQSREVNGFDEQWVTQGPGNIGARINTVAVHPDDEQTIYVGFSRGGVFKTTDGGSTWTPIFDEQIFLSIGDIEVDPNHPETVYVGTGDVNITGTPGIGDGLYRSTDGGNTWTHLGLEAQRIISKIVIDPSNSERLFVATMGLPFERNHARGLYRSEDNGATWEQVLFISDSTGVIDVVMNPENPDILYAAGWDRIRNHVESVVSGYGARVYKTTDGGDTWTLLEGGLPNDVAHTRIGLAMSGTDPDVVFVQYGGENLKFEAIYKTTDGGNAWTPMPTDEDLNGLPQNVHRTFSWFFGKIRVNPNNDNDLFLLGVDLWRTTDGGNNWVLATPPWWEYSVHADKHDLVFLPSGNILLATDGGLYRTDSTALVWEDIENIPCTQFYRVAYNPHQSDMYFGGAQDNGSTGGNASTINDWSRIYGGDGFQMAFDPIDPNRFFVETQWGGINVTLNNGVSFYSVISGFDPDDRFNWDTPYFISPHNPEILYAGSHRVYIGYGAQPYWESISDDLTDGTSQPHRSHNITALDESPILEGLLYVGTGDGNVWRSDNGGSTWIPIDNGLPDQYVTDVVASPTNADVVYVSYSGYKDNDFIPRIHRSTDKGQTWTDLSANLPDLAINEILIYPGHQDSILFVATDGGIYGSIDKATSWERVGTNMPIIVTYDMVLNEAKNELVAGTFARAIMSYPLDSLIQQIRVPPVVATEEVLPVRHEVKIHPSPASNFVQITLENRELSRPYELVVLSDLGLVVHREQGKGNVDVRMDVSHLPQGSYHVSIRIRHHMYRGKFVVQR